MVPLLSFSLSQMVILLTTVKNLLHSTLHICPEVSGFVDLFELQSLFKSEDLYFCFSLELAQKWHFGFFPAVDLNTSFRAQST